ncbi:MAG TPA: hypothetical protein VFL16_09315 [Steroidobacteraceae bacterium]|nr:hypothetical protein [Steroidobacteraceae bacterium]
MVFGLVRLFLVIWIFGFVALVAICTSNYLFSSEPQPGRTGRWHSRLRASLVWPLAVLTSSGRARLRGG